MDNESNEIYVCYNTWYYPPKIYMINGEYFTDKEQANQCIEYWREKDIYSDFTWIKLKNGDNTDFDALIEEVKEQKRIRELELEKLRKEHEKSLDEELLKELEQFAELKARYEGGDKNAIYEEWKEKYKDKLSAN